MVLNNPESEEVREQTTFRATLVCVICILKQLRRSGLAAMAGLVARELMGREERCK